MAKFTITFKQFKGKNETQENVGIEYFSPENGFNDFDREMISKLTLGKHSYTRGPGVSEEPTMGQPNHTFKVTRIK
jgi:hypothetical protein